MVRIVQESNSSIIQYQCPVSKTNNPILQQYSSNSGK